MPLPNIQVPVAEQQDLIKRINAMLNDDKVEWRQRLLNFWKGQRDLVEKYGREGLMMLLDSETQVFVDSNTNRSLEIMHYAEVPEACPWFSLRTLPINEVIEQVWEPFAIGLMDDLVDCCKDLFVIFEAGKWYLVYPFLEKDYDGTQYYQFLAGREAEPDAELPGMLTESGWKMPEDLKDFYRVHGTFGGVSAVLRDSTSHSVCGVSQLKTSLAFLEAEHREKWGVDYSFLDLLTFFEDDGGNSQNFYKADPVGNSYITVDWDHETKQISGGVMLEEFMDYHFGNKLRGE